MASAVDAGAEGAESPAAAQTEKGEAALKAQYITTRERFHEFLAAGSKGQKDDGEECAETSAEGANGTLEEPSGGSESKKRKADEEAEAGKRDRKKMKGQNKSRPHMKPHSYEDRRLCPSVIQERDRKCFYAEKCKFLHDVADYMSTKPADLGDRCYLYDTFGRCMYGITCRFASAHTGPDFKNLVKEEVCKSLGQKETIRNNLDKDLQRRLRKRQVPFDRTEAYLRSIGAGKAKGGANGRKSGSAANTEATCVKEEEKQCEVEQEATAAAADLRTEDEKAQPALVKTIGPLTDADVIKLRPCEKKQVDFRDKLYLAPLTTCGNLPFRRVCKRFGADITCGEMAMCTNLLQGQASEWALLKRHHTEDLFGVQLEGCFPDTMTRCAELLNQNIDVDFVDINSGCPIDLVYKKGGGCGLMTRTNKFEQIVRGMNSVLDVPLTVKIRTGVQQNCNVAHKLIPELKKWGVSLITLHGRSREQRYTKLADWNYIDTCSKLASPVPLFGNGDILSYEDALKARETGVSGIMLARGALIKPWLFTEIKERRHWDISSGERMDILRDFTNYGLEHWGSDTQGVEKTRTFLLEWLSFTCRYIPVGLLERVPQKINERPPFYMGRDYLETLMASQHVGDWIKISEMLLGPVPKNFSFLPKHKANAYK
ncbi:tRNA-dihydrouridine(47) synthase [NAD(P)(+)]-like [Salminus brasiliensis]|uniref:tRNA-dihydrouridine(47) synthase [NAD(P)(+)]-like n=1 Tax=Salminus brasiliensis TaxID=930266 RepID=UPI003B82FCD8